MEHKKYSRACVFRNPVTEYKSIELHTIRAKIVFIWLKIIIFAQNRIYNH